MSTKEETLDLSGSRRRSSGPKAGSVWESRMKLDEVKGGFKVFNATLENPQENSNNATTSDVSKISEAQMDAKVTNAVRPKQSPVGKRKTWKSEGSSPVQIVKKRSESRNNLDQGSNKELCDLKKSPVQIKKKTPISATLLRKVKSDSDEKIKSSDEDAPDRGLEGYNGKIDKSPPDRVRNLRSDEDCSSDGEEVKEIEAEKKSFNIKETSVPEKVVIEDKKLLHNNDRPVLISSIVKKHTPPAVFHSSPTKTKPISDNLHGIPRRNGRLQSFVDLVMWRDVSKSAFIFGIGTFGIISSLYTKDLNISFISVISYLFLVYLAAIFVFRSFISRGSMDMESENKDCVVGEEEAIRVVKLIVPYLNEFLLKLRALFSGDPATTMKLAVFLFILARCGSSITIWKMAKLGFIGVFTVPKICSTYSSQLTAYGTFWIRRFRDAWESCSHKKAVAFAIFTLVWNLSSVVARICAVFMLFVAFKYYQQSLIREGWTNEGKTGSIGGPKSGQRSTTITEIRKQNKVC